MLIDHIGGLVGILGNIVKFIVIHEAPTRVANRVIFVLGQIRVLPFFPSPLVEEEVAVNPISVSTLKQW